MIPELTRQRSVLILVLAGCIILSFVLRILPWFHLDLQGFELYRDPDVWYNFRQIEVMTAHFPQYNWFDPMTAYPTGKNLDWGPLFPLLASILSLAAGAAQRSEIIAVSFWIPVLFGLLMIPVVFFIARLVAGWKAGIIAAVMMAFISGDYFYRTMGGVVDHHCAEVFFTTLFCLFYILALRQMSENGMDIRNAASLKKPLLISMIAGVALAAGLAVVTTTILFALIIAIFTLVQYILDVFRGRRTDYLLLVNGVVSACAIGGLALVGIQSPVYALSTYSAAPIHAFILLFCGTAFLQGLSMATRDKPWIFISLVGLSLVAGLSVAFLFSQSIISSGFGAISTLFGQSFWEFPIEEQKPWSFTQMWTSYNIGIFLAFIGFFIVSYRFLKRECPAHLFVLVWGVMVIIATIQHSRFEYYSAVFIVVSSAAALAYFLSYDETMPGKKYAGKPIQEKKGKKDKKKRESSSRSMPGDAILSGLQGTGVSFVLACMVIFCGVSVLYDYSIATTSENTLVPQQWIGVLEWMERGTPPAKISYTGPYEREGFEYPPGSYGVLSWWDYGHWITFISGRIPVTNPFQDNVVPASLYFFAESEDDANRIADNMGARYVITDWKMVDSKLAAMVIWYNSSLGEHPVPGNYFYESYYITPEERQNNQSLVNLYKQHYYQTMVSRLHNFDGTLTQPSEVVFVQYRMPDSMRRIPEVEIYEVLDIDNARKKLALFESAPHEGREAAILNTGTDTPADTISALRHYRLVYEEGEQRAASSFTNSVKVFEYVRGAKVMGKGLIEVTIQTNQGRTFVYRQESENGGFVLPYSTTSAYPVKTQGPYRFISSGKTLEVSEKDVLEGNTLLV